MTLTVEQTKDIWLQRIETSIANAELAHILVEHLIEEFSKVDEWQNSDELKALRHYWRMFKYNGNIFGGTGT